jgi:outer membrane protein assembly factor BamB
VVIAARLGDTMFVGEDRVFLVSAIPGPVARVVQNKIVSTYALPSGELLSRTEVAVTGAILNVVAVDHTILVSYQVDTSGAEATVALTAGTNRALWRHASRLLATSAPDGLVLLRENSPQAGSLNFFGVHLATGDVRWSLQQPFQGFTTEAGSVGDFPHYLVTATYAGDLEVRDTRTGTVLARTRVPIPVGQAGNDLPVWTAENLVMVGGVGGTTAYRLPDLAERWHSTMELTGRWVQPDCAGKICSMSWRGGMRVLDPATGELLWSSDRWSIADQVGSYLLASNNLGREPDRSLSVVEPATGAIRGDFGPWHAAGEARGDGTVIGLREQFVDDIVWYALLDPDAITVRVLGAAEQVSGDCQATRRALVCRRIDASVGIWTLK